MASMPLALSVHNFISSVGADAGFAAIIGLAILVLLYFAHARETANLREQAALLTQRLQQAEARVAQLSRAQPAVAAQPAQVAQAAAGPARAYPTAIPAAPAGVAAPALLAATRVVPLVVQPQPAAAPVPVPAPALAPVGAPAEAGAEPTSPEPAAPVPVPAPAPATAPTAPAAPAPAPASAAPAASAATAAPPQSAPAPAAASSPGPSPSPAPAAAATDSPGPPAAPAALTAAGANGAGHDRVETPVDPVADGGAERTSAPARVAPPPSARPTFQPLGPPPRRGSRVWPRVVLLVGALLVVGAVAAVLIATADTGKSHTASGSARTTNTPARGGTRSAAKFNPALVTVAVLNGTATNQLAHRVGDKLVAVGYKEGAIATAANQTETTTIVSYLPGTTNRTDALHVATALKLRPTSVRPIDQSTQQVACPPPAACSANVVVTVGADLANS